MNNTDFLYVLIFFIFYLSWSTPACDPRSVFRNYSWCCLQVLCTENWTGVVSMQGKWFTLYYFLFFIWQFSQKWRLLASDQIYCLHSSLLIAYIFIEWDNVWTSLLDEDNYLTVHSSGKLLKWKKNWCFILCLKWAVMRTTLGWHIDVRWLTPDFKIVKLKA